MHNKLITFQQHLNILGKPKRMFFDFIRFIFWFYIYKHTQYIQTHTYRSTYISVLNAYWYPRSRAHTRNGQRSLSVAVAVHSAHPIPSHHLHRLDGRVQLIIRHHLHDLHIVNVSHIVELLTQLMFGSFLAVVWGYPHHSWEKLELNLMYLRKKIHFVITTLFSYFIIGHD